MPENLEVRNGIYYYRAVINGTLHRKSTGFKVGSRDNLKLAQRRASEIESEIRSGKLGWRKPEAPLFHVWAESFLNAYHPGRYTERNLMTRPKKYWNDRPLNTITESEIRTYLNSRKTQGAAPGTLERERVLLAGLFRTARRNKHIDENPMEEIGSIDRAPRTTILTREDEPKLRAILSPVWDRYLTISLGTGLRRTELLMARPVDIRDDQFLWVRPESNKLKKGRLVPLRPEVLKALRDQQALRIGVDTTPFFAFRGETVTGMFTRWCRRLKLPVVTPHAFRRTFGTRCALAGMYPRHLQLIMGHTSIEITMKFYVHLEQQSLLDALKGVTL